ncbi:ATP-binding cassette domain-containing protein [Natribaculum luteum]|uniref:ATP-binding cassette domain-containing protein n=1 Tax=Natribaculum luteum TaxID=1586232 RepID=A0ABD5P4Q4_9EURY|nr:ABC transporter ATP-binding protein [Natribaculum luteum]
MSAIELRDVEKRFGDVPALRGIDLEVERGEVFGFLGPNGAGKSTTIDLLVNHRYPTAGTIEVLGYDAVADPVAIRQRVGLLPEGFSPLGTMTGRQHVEYAIAATDADDDPEALLEQVDLLEAASRPASGYSKGMAQRLALAMALVGDPDLLVLDEPSTGLDPHGVRRMREIIREAVDEGTTVFFSSHILEQVEAVCDRVGIMNDGRLVAVDSIEGLRETVGADGTIRVDLADDPDEVRGVVERIDGVSTVETRDGGLTVACSAGTKLAVLDEVRAAGGTITDFTTADASLEDLFVAYTRRSR